MQIPTIQPLNSCLDILLFTFSCKISILSLIFLTLHDKISISFCVKPVPLLLLLIMFPLHIHSKPNISDICLDVLVLLIGLSIFWPLSSTEKIDLSLPLSAFHHLKFLASCSATFMTPKNLLVIQHLSNRPNYASCSITARPLATKVQSFSTIFLLQ